MADIIELISQILEVNQEIKLQKNLQTEDVTNTVDKRLTALQDISESFNFQKPEFIPEPEPQIYLCSPMVQTQLYHPSFISVTVPEPQTISYLQPAIYPQTYPMAMYHPQVFYLTMAPWTDSPTGWISLSIVLYINSLILNIRSILEGLTISSLKVQWDSHLLDVWNQ